MVHWPKLMIRIYGGVHTLLSQAKTSIKLLRFSLDKESFFFHNRTTLIEMIKQTMKIDDFIILIFAIIGITLAIYENNHYYEKANYQANDGEFEAIYIRENLDDELSIVLRSFISLSTITVVKIDIFLIRRYNLYLALLKTQNKIEHNATLLSTKLIFLLGLELFINTIHFPPIPGNPVIQINAMQEYYIDFQLSSAIILFMFNRFYLVFRYFAFHSEFNNMEAIIICNRYNAVHSLKFLMKVLLHYRSGFIICLIFTSLLITGGFSLQIVERPFMFYSLLNWDYVWNGFWCVIVLVTTVGYGDIYPRTQIGRVIATNIMFFANFFTSLITFHLKKHVEFTPREKRAYEKLKFTKQGEKVRLLGSNIIKYCFKFELLRSKNNGSDSLVLISSKIRYFLTNFHKERNLYNTMKLERKIHLTSNNESHYHKVKLANLNEIAKNFRSIEKKLDNIDLHIEGIFAKMSELNSKYQKITTLLNKNKTTFNVDLKLINEIEQKIQKSSIFNQKKHSDGNSLYPYEICIFNRNKIPSKFKNILIEERTSDAIKNLEPCELTNKLIKTKENIDVVKNFEAFESANKVNFISSNNKMNNNNNMSDSSISAKHLKKLNISKNFLPKKRDNNNRNNTIVIHLVEDGKKKNPQIKKFFKRIEEKSNTLVESCKSSANRLVSSLRTDN